MNRRTFFQDLASGLFVAAAPTIFIPKLSHNLWPQKISTFDYRGNWLQIDGSPQKPQILKRIPLPLTNASLFDIKKNILNLPTVLGQIEGFIEGTVLLGQKFDVVFKENAPWLNE